MTTPTNAPTKTEQALKLRMTALYHNCMSSACFKREDALKEEDENEAITLRREASAYEAIAGWLSQASK
jgi:hypothetical protein